MFNQLELESLMKGDLVEFVPDTFHQDWKNKARFYESDLNERIFISKAITGRLLYILSYDIKDLIPKEDGGIDIRDKSTFSPDPRYPNDPDYEMLEDFLENG